MRKLVIPLAVVVMLSGCATGSAIREKITNEQFDAPKVAQPTFLQKKENQIKPPVGGPIPIAVYSFADKTGQRKYAAGYASFSTAVTQGGEGFLIKALQDAGDGRWFKVVERVGLDNLIKERQMIRQMREAYQGKDAQPLPPMVFAGVIVEGGIVGYDSNSMTGGAGVSVFGIGASTQYQSDTVTINLRTVSVQTGEILTNVTVTKTVLSYMDKLTLMRWFNNGTDTLESELGGSINESINKAVDIAIQAAVVQTINEGARKGHWAFKETVAEKVIVPEVKVTEPPEAKEEPKVEIPKKIEVKKEEPVTPAPTKEEPKVESLPGTMYLKLDSYVYKEADDKSQKTWLLKKGVELSVVDSKGEWVQVRDAQHRRGWVNKEVLVSKP
jgi:curli production assembly/transport component CsgG